jgi:HSP20 family protein
MEASPFMHPVAVKLYRTPDRLTVAAPMLGLLPQDISVEVTARGQLVLRGPVRGITADVQLFHRLDTQTDAAHPGEPVEETRELLLDEWSVGPYHRTLDLPNPVNGTLATATYGNGVLVVTLPIAERTTAAQLSLDPIGIGRGERVGSIGHPIQPSSTAEHARVAHHAL